jgi:hypothetical protein
MQPARGGGSETMGVDYAEKEREFLDGLAEDTGRDLAGWMAAIRETNLTDRNAIIDWLRQQGFLFARASWLERIHHNGGRPIYIDPEPAGRTAALTERPFPQSGPRSSNTKGLPAAVEPEPVTPPPAGAGLAQTFKRPPPVQPPAKTGGPSLDALLAEAKGYRPLAQLLLREIENAVPETAFEPRDGYIAIMRRGACVGALTLSAKELRVALAAGTQAVPAPFTKAKFTKTLDNMPASMTHMIILNDARQVTPELIAAFRRVLSGS